MSLPRETEEITMVNARRELTRLPERLETSPTTVAVTRRGKPVLAIMSWQDYEAIIETLEILGDEDAMEQLRRSVREVKEGKAIPWDAVTAQLST